MHRLRVLGPLEVDGAAEVLGPRDRIVVSALALRTGERVDAETLAEALWGEGPPASAAKVVQGCVSRLRKALGAGAIETVDGGYRLRSDELDIDRQQFEDRLERARGYLSTRTPERAIPLLTDALALWRGPAFGELEDWMPGRLEAVRLGQLRLAAEEDLLQARLDCGDHSGVATDGTVLTGQQPFRERRWALLALAQYRSGRQADALASIRSARRSLGQELGLDPGSELVLLERRILAQDPGLATDHAARMADQPCPWKGLAAYGDQDGETFFGRDADIASCLGRLQESPLLVVTGPSGSGKSSLVQAGLVPALRRSGAEVEVFTPGADGALAMAAARSRRAGDPWLVIDQFEETFTLSGATFARPWLGKLARYALESAPVVMVIRGDHVAELGADPELVRLAERGLHLVAPLAGERLREAIEGPAQVAGLRLESGLVDLVVRDADGQPGALPLLSHALAETWQRREAGLLTVDGYRAAGGISDAVAASAERLYEGLSTDEREELRWLMLRLVSLSDGGEPFRTPLPASVVAALDPVRRRLLDLLVRGRLVTSADGGYDLAHEALVRAWPRLRVWLEEDRIGQQIRRHLAMAATGWQALDRPEGELYRGARLGAALEWLERGHEPLDDTQRDFIEASRAVADEDVRRLADETRRQRRQNRRLRALVAVAAVLLMVAAAAGVVARDQGLAAERGEGSAAASAAAARHESLVARSLALRSSNRAAAALLAVQAWREKPDVLARSALMATVTAAPGFLGYFYLELGRHAAAAEVPGRRQFVAAVGTTVALVDPTTGRNMRRFTRAQAVGDFPTTLVRVSADGGRAVLLTPAASSSCDSCSEFVVYDVTDTRAIFGPVTTPYRAVDVAISPDGNLVALATADGIVGVFDVEAGRRIAQARTGATAVAFGVREELYLGSVRAGVREVLARRPQTVLRKFAIPRKSSERRVLVASGRLVTVGSGGEAAIDLTTGQTMWTSAHDQDPTEVCDEVAVSVALGHVYCGSSSGLVVDRDLETGRARQVLDPQLGSVSELMVVESSSELFVIGEGRSAVARWRIDGPGANGRLIVPHAVATAGYNQSGRLLVVRQGSRSEVVTGSGTTVRPLPEGHATWLSPTTVGIVRRPHAGRNAVLVDVVSGRRTPVPLSDVEALYAETSETHAWAVSRNDRTYRLQRFSVPSGDPADPPITPYEGYDDLQVESNGELLLVTLRHDSSYFTWYSQEHLIADGREVSKGIQFVSQVLIAPSGAIIGVNLDGDVEEYESPLFFDPRRSFAAGRGAAAALQLSEDGSLLAVTALDRTVSIYDLATGTRLGDPVQTGTSADTRGSWLRPDGRALVTSMASGVVRWDLDPESLVAAACQIAGRNPTVSEWESSATDAMADRRICPAFPVDVPRPPQEMR